MSDLHTSDAGQQIEHVFRSSYGRLTAGLCRVFGAGHLDLAEDVVQEALVRALRTWPFQGVPRDPQAWLAVTARRIAIDAVRRRAWLRDRERALEDWPEAGGRDAERPGQILEDDRLRLLFTGCHPALPIEDRVALTLKTLGGFGVPEIARAFLTSEDAVAQRLVRAKRKIREDQIPFEVPTDTQLAARVDGVLEVVYLMFNEGITPRAKHQPLRSDLVEEAIRLGRLLADLPAARLPRTHALLALMLLQGARMPARVSELGDLLTLSKQDRSRWNRDWLHEGFSHFERSISGDSLSPYHVEAAIASVHACAPRYEDTRWPVILEYYDQLVALAPSGIVSLNRAVAVAKVQGFPAALREIEKLSTIRELQKEPLLPAVRAHWLWASGAHPEAADSFRRALEMLQMQRQAAAGESTPLESLLLRRLEACLRGEPAEDV